MKGKMVRRSSVPPPLISRSTPISRSSKMLRFNKDINMNQPSFIGKLDSKIDLYGYEDTVIDGVPSTTQRNGKLCWDLKQLSSQQQFIVKLSPGQPFWLVDAYPAFQKHGDKAYDLLYTDKYGFYTYVCKNMSD